MFILLGLFREMFVIDSSGNSLQVEKAFSMTEFFYGL